MEFGVAVEDGGERTDHVQVRLLGFEAQCFESFGPVESGFKWQTDELYLRWFEDEGGGE